LCALATTHAQHRFRSATMSKKKQTADADDVFSFPIDNEQDQAALLDTKKKLGKKKTGGFQSMNLLPSM
jgi:hypothetical protein